MLSSKASFISNLVIIGFFISISAFFGWFSTEKTTNVNEMKCWNDTFGTVESDVCFVINARKISFWNDAENPVSSLSSFLVTFRARDEFVTILSPPLPCSSTNNDTKMYESWEKYAQQTNFTVACRFYPRKGMVDGETEEKGSCSEFKGVWIGESLQTHSIPASDIVLRTTFACLFGFMAFLAIGTLIYSRIKNKRFYSVYISSFFLSFPFFSSFFFFSRFSFVLSTSFVFSTLELFHL